MAEQQAINTHLLAVLDGDANTPFDSDLTGASFDLSTGTVAEGRYQVRIKKGTAYKRTADGSGVNVHFDMSIIGPAGCSEVGKRLRRDNPVPVGPRDDAKVQGKMYYHGMMWGSFLSAEGVPEDKIRGLGVMPKTPPSKFDEKTAYVYVTETESNKGNPMNQVAFILKSTYEEKPGPAEKVERGTSEGVKKPSVPSTTASQPAQGAQAQSSGGNAQNAAAAPATGPDPVASFLGM